MIGVVEIRIVSRNTYMQLSGRGNKDKQGSNRNEITDFRREKVILEANLEAYEYRSPSSQFYSTTLIVKVR